MKLLKYFALFLFTLSTANFSYAQTSLGTIQANTNLALPSSYNMQEYVFGEPNDQGTCTGAMNATAQIEEVFMAQTHRQAISHPLFFNVGFRPALFQVAITGSGAAPDVQIEGFSGGASIGTLCLNGPAMLSSSINLVVANFTDYFSVTLPKSWVQPGLSLAITAGGATQTLTGADLKIGPYTEMNLVMVNMDLLDYNTAPPVATIFADFHEELASAIPASVVRFGTFPKTIPFPQFVGTDDTAPLVMLDDVAEVFSSGVSEGNINYLADRFLENIQHATGDYLSTYYFGNTLNLTPGGWGGDKHFVTFDYGDIFIHELGHALGLPHWEEDFNIPPPSDDNYLYPYGGNTNDGGGRGEAWTFVQDTYEFEDPTCRDPADPDFGIERSDCMQREFPCFGQRTSDLSPWDGFGYFSAISMHRNLIGADVEIGQVPYKGSMIDYQLSFQDGSPVVSLVGGQRVHTRAPEQWPSTYPEENNTLPGTEQIEKDVYLIYGTAHPTQAQANIVYEPVKYKGTLPPVQDPTNATTFTDLQNFDVFQSMFYWFSRDITVKITYLDGTILHAIVPWDSYDRDPVPGDFGLARLDMLNFSLVVPADKEICNVEVYKRPFCIRYDDDDAEGNINYVPHGITAANFMDAAELLSTFDFNGATCPNFKRIKAKVLLQGAYNGTDMNTTLQTGNLLPESHPFTNPAYGHTGTESITTASLPADVVDWVLVEIRDPSDNTNVIATRAGLLRKDGMILDLDGIEGLKFTNLPVASGFIAVRHRNHLGVMSSAVQTF